MKFQKHPQPEAIKENIKYKDLSSTLSSHPKNKNDKSSNSKSSEKIANNKTTNNLSNDDNIFSNLYKNNKKTNLKIVKDNISVDNESNLEQFINSLPEKIVDNFFQKNKKNKENNENNENGSIILEMNSDDVKPCEVEKSSPKFANAMKILNETNVIKNNSYNKLNELSKKTQNISNINNNFDSHNNKNEDNNINNTKSNKESDSETDSETDSESDLESKSNSENNTSNSSLNNEKQFDNFVDLGGNSFVFADFAKKSAKQNKVVELN